MRYLDLFSGISAASVAFAPLGWDCVGFAEVDPFPCKVLKHHNPSVKNFGDVTNFEEWKINEPIDIIIGGSPCQSFSVAGRRRGVADPRGYLMFTYLAIVDRYKPRFVVWENVPGVLSSNKGRDFGAFLGGLGECGYHDVSYAVLDAQYFGVPQRRRRVFVVGCLGKGSRSAAILFDEKSLRGNFEEGAKKGKDAPPCSPTSFGGYSESRISNTLKRQVDGSDSLPLVMSTGQANAEITENIAPTLNCNHEQPIIAIPGNVIGRKPKNGGNGLGADETEIMYTLTKSDVHAVCMPINLQIATRHNSMGERTGLGIGNQDDPAYTLQANHGHGIFDGMAIRRITPLECERLQGFPDQYSNIPGASDTNRYRALGNSMAVPVVRHIGERIEAVSKKGKIG